MHSSSNNNIVSNRTKRTNFCIHSFAVIPTERVPVKTRINDITSRFNFRGKVNTTIYNCRPTNFFNDFDHKYNKFIYNLPSIILRSSIPLTSYTTPWISSFNNSLISLSLNSLWATPNITTSNCPFKTS